MRRVAVLAAAALILVDGGVGALPAGAQTEACSTQRTKGDRDGTSEVQCVASKTTTLPGGVYRPRAPAPRFRLRTPAPEVVNMPDLVFVPPVGLCRRRSTYTVLRSELAAMPADALDPMWLRLVAPYPRCPTIQVVPEDAAIDVLERVPLPAPSPHIAPGYAITGKPGYLEPNLAVPIINGKPTAVDNRTTELGDMAVTATAVYRVDWGDAETGPHAGPGGPWPDGNITHTWTDVGTYDVVVTAEWTVRWRLGATEGTLAVPTEGTIAGFRVDQVQAVINR